MNAGQEYDLLGLTHPGPVETWAVRERATGRALSLHRLTGGSTAHATLLQRIARLPAWAAEEILASGESDGVRFFVTEPWLRGESFEEWAIGAGTPNIQGDAFAKVGTWRVPTVEFGKRSALPQKEPGEFTRLFATPAPSATPPVPEPSPEPDPDPNPEPPPPGTPVSPPGLFTSMFHADQLLDAQEPRPAAGGGEFTRMFRAAPPIRPEDAPTVEIQIATMTSAKTIEPDSALKANAEFTRIVEAAPSEPWSSSELPVDEVVESGASQTRESGIAEIPGEFTRMFRIPARAVPSITPAPELGSFGIPPEPPVPADAPSIHPSAEGERGEFTRMFQLPPEPAKAPVPSPGETNDPGEFTRMFQLPPQPLSGVEPPVVNPTSSPSVRSILGEEPAEPSEFSRLFHTSRSKPAPGDSGRTSEPSEFTKNFQGAGKPASSSSAVQPPETAPSAGEFSRFFERDSSPPPSPPSAVRMPAAPPADPPVASGPGEFTRMFQPPPSATPSPGPVPQAAPADFDKLFNPAPTPSGPGAHPAFKDPFGANRSPGAYQSESAGEYTQMFGTPVASGPAPNVPTPSAVTPPPAPAARQPEMGTYTKMFSTNPVEHPTERPDAPQQRPANPLTSAFPVTPGGGMPQSVLVNPAGRETRKPVARKPRSNAFVLYIVLGILLVALVIVVVVLAFR